MTYKAVVLLILMAALFPSCGSSSPTLRSITVSPNPASATSLQSTVSFSAMGTMSNNSTRSLSSNNGLVWGSSNPTVATIASSGVATCLSSGSITITATAPDNINKGSSAAAVSGTATLSCS
jgi:hypothetical protein